MSEQQPLQFLDYEGLQEYTKHVKTLVADKTDLLDMKLSEDLYTYTPVGMAQKATDGIINSTGTAISNKNPGKIGTAGETSLKDVFSAIFGEAQDEEPTSIIDTRGISYSYTAGPTLGQTSSEVGTAITTNSITITVTASGSCTSTYGYYTAVDTGTGKPSTMVYEANKTLTYTISNQTINNQMYKLKLTLPKNYYKTGNSGDTTVTVTPAPVYIDGANIYINATSATITVPNTFTTQAASSQTIYGAIKTSCKFDALKDSNGATVLGFLTYQKNSAKVTTAITNTLNSKAISDTASTALTINSGTRFVYYAITDSGTTAPTSWTKYGSGQTSVTGIDISVDAGKYLWIASTTKYAYLRLYNELNGKYNGENASCYISTTTNSITNSKNVTASGYYFYATGPRKASGNVKLKLSNSLTD